MNNMVQISKIPMGVLKDEEFFQIGDQILVALESNNAEALKLGGVYNLFKESLSLARLKNKTKRMHPLSPSIILLTEEIHDWTMSILNINKGHKKAVPPLQKVSAAITVPFIEESLAGFTKQNSFVRRERLKAFFDEIDKNSTLSAALTTMNWKPLLDHLREMYTKLLDKRAQRNQEKLPPVTESNLFHLQQAKKMLRKLCMVIETNAMVETELNYEPLIFTINSIISELMRVVNMRRTGKNDVPAEAKNTTAPEAIKPSGAATVNLESAIKPSL